MEYRSPALPLLTYAQFSIIFGEIYTPYTSYWKKDEFLALGQGNMYIEVYEAKFHALSGYATQLHGTKDESTWLSVKGLNIDLQVLFVHMI